MASRVTGGIWTTNLYETLGVPQDATGDEIRKAYHRLSLQYHPDRAEGDDGKFQAISGAYEILRENASRMRYDAQLRLSSKDGGMDEGKGVEGNRGYGGQGVYGVGIKSDNGIDIGEILRGLSEMNKKATVGRVEVLGGVRGEIPESIMVELKVEMEQSYTGCTLPVTIVREIETTNRYGERVGSSMTEVLYVDVPMGVDNNEIIRLEGLGHRVDRLVGDVLVRVILCGDGGDFRREGLNLHYEKEITLRESLCGIEFDVILFGKTYTICNDGGNVIPSYHKKVVRGLGMRRGEHVGNLVICFVVKFPKRVTLEQRKWLSENI